MRIALFYNHIIHEDKNENCMRDIIRQAGITCDHFNTSDAHQLKNNYDLYFRIDHGDYAHDIPPSLHPAIFYAVDTHLRKPYRKIKEQAKHYDIVFCAQQPGVKPLRKDSGTDVQWAPLGCNPKVHKKIDVPKKYDVGFVGRDAQKFDRGKFLPLLRLKYPNSFIGRAPFEELSAIYSASKIGFNSSIRDDVNLRVFEIMASGTFLLTNRINNDGLYEMFEDGRHMVTYSSTRDLLEKIDYYLKNEKEREEIAQAGYKKVTGSCTLFHTVQKIFNYVAFKWSGEYNALRI